MSAEKANFRYVSIKGAIYLRAEDVADYIRKLAETEETNTRKRLEQAALNIEKTHPI